MNRKAAEGNTWISSIRPSILEFLNKKRKKKVKRWTKYSGTVKINRLGTFDTQHQL